MGAEGAAEERGLSFAQGIPYHVTSCRKPRGGGQEWLLLGGWLGIGQWVVRYCIDIRQAVVL